MNVFLWILTVLGILIGVILLLILHLIFGRIRLVAQYRNGEIKIWLRWLFLKYTVYPDPEKELQKQQQKQAKQESSPLRESNAPKTSSATAELEKKTKPIQKEAKKSTPKKKMTVRSAAKKEIRKALRSVNLKDYATLLQIIVTKFIAKFRCEKFILHASVGGEDAMSIAMDYGTINALLYPVLGAFSAAGKLKRCDVQITPDFTSEETHGEGRAEFSFRLFRAFGCIWELSEKLY